MRETATERNGPRKVNARSFGFLFGEQLGKIGPLLSIYKPSASACPSSVCSASGFTSTPSHIVLPTSHCIMNVPLQHCHSFPSHHQGGLATLNSILVVLTSCGPRIPSEGSFTAKFLVVDYHHSMHASRSSPPKIVNRLIQGQEFILLIQLATLYMSSVLLVKGGGPTQLLALPPNQCELCRNA